MMNTLTPLVFGFLMLTGLVAQAAAPVLKAPVSLKDGTSDIDVGDYSAAAVSDWNGDGKTDLLVGQFSGGQIRLYLNTGSATDPQFTGFSYLQSPAGTPITTTAG